MKTYAALLAAASLLGTAGISHAGQSIISTSMRTGTGTSGACYIRNVGNVPVTLQATMYQNIDFPIIINVNTCNGALQAGRTCVVLANDLPDDVTFACTATAAGSAKNLRGNVELRAITSSGLRVILSDELR